MTTTEEIDVTHPFSETIKNASWEVHERAEQLPFVQRLMSGKASFDEYADMVAQHYFAYRALERFRDEIATDPIAGPFAAPELLRVPALEDDLEALYGPDWRDRIAPSAATLAFVARLEEVGSTWPGGYIAHHYVRYLGDLSGG
ncbi:MAG TPA: biliverdin-producing heme oxygenase, partial [Ilumatobacteraceae bacterium]|nr:biliverdin-producing heme oxygenase [Ilumatobacteraceae bacterium]